MQLEARPWAMLAVAPSDLGPAPALVGTILQSVVA